MIPTRLIAPQVISALSASIIHTSFDVSTIAVTADQKPTLRTSARRSARRAAGPRTKPWKRKIAVVASATFDNVQPVPMGYPFILLSSQLFRIQIDGMHPSLSQIATFCDPK
jgi:hypothetical protein